MADVPVKAVPSPSLSPVQILGLAKEEGLVWKELAFTDEKLPGTPLFDVFLKTLLGVSQATNKEHVKEAVDEFAMYCLKTAGRGEAEKICAGIARRREFLQGLAEHQYAVEAELEEMEREIAHHRGFKGNEGTLAKLSRKKERCESFIGELVTLKGPIQHEIETLEQYARALERVSNGYPAELVNKALPSVAALSEKPVEESPLPSADTPVSTTEVRFPERRSVLASLAETHGFLEAEVLAYSLFDLLGENNHLLGARFSPQRSLRRAVELALQIVPGFGWKSAREAFVGSGWKDDTARQRGYLVYRGSMSGLAMWLRSGKPLPWDARALFTEEEARQFLEKMK